MLALGGLAGGAGDWVWKLPRSWNAPVGGSELSRINSFRLRVRSAPVLLA